MFSATYGGYRNTITVSKNDAQRANAIAAEYKLPAQNKQNYQQRIIGNIEYSQIRDRNFINTDPATALQVANLLSGDTSIRFSGRILANSATITVSGRKNAEMVNRMIENIRNADIINELYRAGYERMADTNGFVNIRNNGTGEIVGFRSMDMVREMFHDQSNEFFHPSAYRVDMTAETTQPYYISEVEKSSAEERNVYVDENGGVPTFESQPEAEEYASNNGIDLSDFEEIVSEEETISENVPVENVPLEHREEQEETQGSSYLGNSEHAVFDTYNNDVRAYRAKNAYGDYVKKQKRKPIKDITLNVLYIIISIKIFNCIFIYNSIF